MNCKQCTKLMPDPNSPFCPFCGATQEDTTGADTTSSDAGQTVPMQTVAEQLEAAQSGVDGQTSSPDGSQAVVPPPPGAAPMQGFNPEFAQQPPAKKRLPGWAIALIAGGIALILAFCCCIAILAFSEDFWEGFDEGFNAAMQNEQRITVDPIAPPPANDDSNGANDTDANDDSDLTMSQQQAIRSAKEYLEFMSFSEEGLIQQLSSEFGDGFPEEDARFAVESLDVDWYEQAVKSAESYLDFMSFSRQGLIDQLSSEFGDMFTVEQAEHAADAVGL